MRPPFPGMDPWLENPDLWPDVHNSLITCDPRCARIRRLVPRYFVGVESRTTVLTGLDVDLVYKPGLSIHATESRAADPADRRRRARAARGRSHSRCRAQRAKRSKRHS